MTFTHLDVEMLEHLASRFSTSGETALLDLVERIQQQINGPAAPGYILAPVEPDENMVYAGGIGRRDQLVDAAAVYRAMLAAIPERTAPRYTCIGKGGEYELLGAAKGAGWSKQGETLAVYRDTKTGALFYRMLDDFENRMEQL